MEAPKKFTTIKDIMSDSVVTVSLDDPLVGAVDIILKNGFNGLPVINKDGVLVGILTQYDLMIRGSSIYLPTFLKLLQEFQVYRDDKTLIKGDLKKIAVMKVKDIMNSDPLTLKADQPIDEAIKAFSEHHKVNPIPIVDEKLHVLGILSRSDLLKLIGGPAVRLSIDPQNDRMLDKNVNKFLSDFEKEFVLVSRFRTKYWFLVSILFVLVGILISFAFIVRVVYK